MRYVLRLGAAAVLLFSTAGCFSFKLRPLPPPVNRVESLLMCAAVEESGELLKPGEPLKEFDPGRGEILCFLRLEEVDQRIALRWKWYSPENELVKDTGPTEVNPEEKYLAVVTAYDRLNWRPGMGPAGTWTVAVYIDGDLIGRLSFKMKSDEAPS